MYIENPKTKGSGILCAIPQCGECPIKCDDCFFQSGRSYLEPLSDNLPNLPDRSFANLNNFVVRMNDGNDSNNNSELVIYRALDYENVFFNTSMPNIEHFKEPTVLTINPAKITDTSFHKLNPIPNNLMFVRFRVNMWNLDLLNEAIKYYTSQNFPIILTFMAYYTTEIPKEHRNKYEYKTRILNSYNLLKPEFVKQIKTAYETNSLVYYCEGKLCKHCGNCIREYYNTKVRILEG